MTITPEAGSSIVRVFETIWQSIRETHAELPDVVFVTGGGLSVGPSGITITWGHFGADHWETADGPVAEIMVSGESLTREPHETLTTILHEAAHALNHVRGEKGTSRRGAYHNRRFVAAAESLGLAWPDGQEPDKTRGFSGVRITDETRERYAALLDLLAAERIAWRNLFGLTLGGESGGQGGDGERGAGTSMGSAPKPRSRNTKPKAVCDCGPESAIYAARRVLDREAIMCTDCGGTYRVLPEYV